MGGDLHGSRAVLEAGEEGVIKLARDNHRRRIRPERRFVVEIDGEQVGRLSIGRVDSWSVSAGRHFVGIGFKEHLTKLEVDVPPGGSVLLWCGYRFRGIYIQEV